jgi:predicted RNase H-like HicB family nuclease
MKQFTVIFEHGPTSWGAYVPDLPGCVAAGSNRDEVESLIREAVAMHIEDLRSRGEAVPEPVSTAGSVTVAA